MLCRDCYTLSILTFLQKHNFHQGLKLIKQKWGLIIALLIVALWAINVNIGLHLHLNDISWFELLLLILGQTFLWLLSPQKTNTSK